MSEHAPLCELNLEEAAEYLRVKKSWLYATARQIPRTKFAGRVWFRRADLDAYLATFTVTPR